MQKLRIGVLRGGPSSLYDLSLRTGGHVLKNLSEDFYSPQDIYISRSGVWHVRGLETTPERALKNVDVVFNALHGEYGEDGTVQRLLDTFNVPYTGSRALSSSLAMNKSRAKDVVSRLGIRTPLSRIVERTDDLEGEAFKIFRTFPQPVVVKPANRGSSIGVVFAGSFDELLEALSTALEDAPQVMIEEYIKGREVTSGVVDNFRGEERYTFLPIEIELPRGRKCFDYEAKHSEEEVEGLRIHCPGNISSDEKLRIRDATRMVHEALGLKHYSRSDFIVTPHAVYFLEANTLPDLGEHSLINRALREAGCRFPEFIDHIVSLASERK